MINSVFTNDPEPFGPIMSYIDAKVVMNRSEPEQFWTMDAKKWMRHDACHIVPNSPGLFAIRNRSESFRTMFEWHGSKDIKEHEVSAMHLWCESGFWIYFGTVWNCVELSSASRNGPKVTQVFKFRCPSALLSCCLFDPPCCVICSIIFCFNCILMYMTSMSPSPLDLQQTTTVFSHFLIFANLLILISNHTAYRYDAYNMSEQLDWIPAIMIRTYTMPWRGQVRTTGHPKFQCQWSDTFLSTGADRN